MLVCVAKWEITDKGFFDHVMIEDPEKPEHEFMLAHGSCGVLSAYQQGYEIVRDENRQQIIAYLHDDCEVAGTDWYDRVAAEFNDPSVGLVGFGGAKRHGTPDLYKRPYKLTNLARFDYFSNQKDAEAHGTRFDGAMDVAVLDGFCLIVRRELLDKMGGWKPAEWPPHHNYDYRVCAEARRYRYRIRMVGVACHHHGGKTATSSVYQEWAKTTKWGSDAEMHRIGHRMFYEQYKDVMPCAV